MGRCNITILNSNAMGPGWHQVTHPSIRTTDIGRQYTIRPASLFIISRNHSQTPDQQTTQHSPYYQLARTHICSPSDYYRLEQTVTRTAPETISQLLRSVSALFTNSSIDILSRDTPAVTGWCPLLDIYRRTQEEKYTSSCLSGGEWVDT